MPFLFSCPRAEFEHNAHRSSLMKTDGGLSDPTIVVRDREPMPRDVLVRLIRVFYLILQKKSRIKPGSLLGAFFHV